MKRIASPKRTRQLIRKHNFRLSKSLGQNFLIDENILQNIVTASGISGDDYVIEIGPGLGSLTEFVASSAKEVLAIEIDKNLLPILEESLSTFDNVKVIHGDILKVDIHKIILDHFKGDRVKVIGNLPYYATTPIIMRFLEEEIPMSSMTIMLQREVAHRMAAQPSTKEYGSLSIAVQYYCQSKLLMEIPPSAFMPQPKVYSALVQLDLLKEPRVQVGDRALFFQMVRDAFGKRRKTLLNALSSGKLNLEKNLLRHIFQRAQIDANRRGETLSIHEFAKLTNTLLENL